MVRSNRNRGIVLLVVVVLMSAIFAISLGIFRVVFGELLITGEISDSTFAFYTADEGIERTLYRDLVNGEELCPPPGTGSPCYKEIATTAQSGGCYDLEMGKTPSGPHILTKVSVTGQYRCVADAVRVVKRAFDLAYLTAVSVFAASGGTVTQSGGHTIHTFTSNGTFTPTRAGNVEVLVVAGGGGGGGDGSGGGGGGGVVYNPSFAVTKQDYTVTVGSGGAGQSGSVQGSNGGNSVFDSINAVGGGGGGSAALGVQDGKNGGSGGGARASGSPGAGIVGQGNSGGSGVVSAGGGGGGAGVAGSAASGADVGGNGGAGATHSISGSQVTYGGGGGGGSDGGSTGGAGGAGGGGAGGYWGGAPGVCPVAGTANTGGGGGGGANSCPALGKFGADGGSGIVIIRYLTQ